MALALFDLDNTLLADDSDYLWGQYLVDQGLVDKHAYDDANKRFYDAYKQGTLDIDEFLAFSLAPLTRYNMQELAELHAGFMQQHILGVMTDKGREYIQMHKARGDTTVIITATNRFVTEPIAREFGVDDLIATDPEIIDQRYTGKVSGTPCFQHGKIVKLEEWLKDKSHKLEGSSFYSDSHNDIPLLERVTNAVAVDPDTSLRDTATERGWQILSFRD